MTNPKVGEKVHIKHEAMYRQLVGRHGIISDSFNGDCIGITIDDVVYWMDPEDVTRAKYNIHQSYCRVCHVGIFRITSDLPWYHDNTDMMMSVDMTHFATTRHYRSDMNKTQSCYHCGHEIAYDHSVDVWYHIETDDRSCVGCDTYAAYRTSKALFLYALGATVVAALGIALLMYMFTR